MNWWPMHSWHPVMVHLPLVGLLFAALFDVVAAQRRSNRWREGATVLWWLGLLGAAAAVTTGLIAYNRVEHSDIGHRQMLLHRNVALASILVLLITALWRWRRPYTRGGAFLGILGAVGLAGAGYIGGDLVYRHAIGISNDQLEQISHERGGQAQGHPGEGEQNKQPDHGH